MDGSGSDDSAAGVGSTSRVAIGSAKAPGSSLAIDAGGSGEFADESGRENTGGSAGANGAVIGESADELSPSAMSSGAFSAHVSTLSFVWDDEFAALSCRSDSRSLSSIKFPSL